MRTAKVPRVAPFAVAVTDALAPQQARDVRAAVTLTADGDGVAPLSEDAELRVRPEAEDVVHLLVSEAGDVVGYGQLDLGSDAGNGEVGAELFVAPPARRRGVGTSLLRATLETAGQRQRSPVGVWAHGDLPGSAELAAAFGLTRVRDLWQMRASLAEPIAEPAVPDGVRIRPFVPGVDEAAWLALNSAAFAHHPEQGSWTADDLALREQEDWFDPAGLFLAEAEAGAGAGAGGQLVGFHWTKVHPATATDPALGEIYVLGVAPAAAGRGLGKFLTAVGLRHLQQQGLTAALLYVEADNAAAISVYERAGFSRHAVDVRYLAAGTSQASGSATIS
ncbi:MAG: mycothiol synthase [Frankiaceae bacterium]|nr:mycothiol synthase [Frankiaceae bacterium]